MMKEKEYIKPGYITVPYVSVPYVVARDKILNKVCGVYDIDISEEYVREMLEETYINEIDVDEDFLRSIGIPVKGLIKRIGERYLRKRNFYDEIKSYLEN